MLAAFVTPVWGLFVNPRKSITGRKEVMQLHKIYLYEHFTGKNSDWKFTLKWRLKDLCYEMGDQISNAPLDKLAVFTSIRIR